MMNSKRKDVAAQLMRLQNEQAAADEMVAARGHELSARITIGTDKEIEEVRLKVVASVEASLDIRIRLGKLIREASTW